MRLAKVEGTMRTMYLFESVAGYGRSRVLVQLAPVAREVELPVNVDLLVAEDWE